MPSWDPSAEGGKSSHFDLPWTPLQDLPGPLLSSFFGRLNELNPPSSEAKLAHARGPPRRVRISGDIDTRSNPPNRAHTFRITCVAEQLPQIKSNLPKSRCFPLTLLVVLLTMLAPFWEPFCAHLVDTSHQQMKLSLLRVA